MKSFNTPAELINAYLKNEAVSGRCRDLFFKGAELYMCLPEQKTYRTISMIAKYPVASFALEQDGMIFVNRGSCPEANPYSNQLFCSLNEYDSQGNFRFFYNLRAI